MNTKDNKKQTYTQPTLERYGNVRDLTQSVQQGSSPTVDSGHSSSRTH